MRSEIVAYDRNYELSGYEENSVGSMILSAFAMVGTAAGAYHGYKRNDSVGWGIWWGFCGAVLPVFTVAIAVAQGFGKPKTS